MVRRCIDKGGVTAMVLMDLSKAYDCLPHDLLLAKLNAYGVGIDSVKLIYSYLTILANIINSKLVLFSTRFTAKVVLNGCYEYEL